MTPTDTSSPAADALRQAGTLVLLVRALDQQLRAGMEPDALSLAELGVLGQVVRGVDLPSQVARALRLDRARVTHLVDRLVECGALTRSLDAQDRRCWRLQITEQGAHLLAEGRATVKAAMEALLGGLAEEERAGLTLGLTGARRLLDAAAAAES
jgi:DNA-binding MarR family transcriptional regulator